MSFEDEFDRADRLLPKYNIGRIATRSFYSATLSAGRLAFRTVVAAGMAFAAPPRANSSMTGVSDEACLAMSDLSMIGVDTYEI
jgi:hypothetical protein